MAEANYIALPDDVGAGYTGKKIESPGRTLAPDHNNLPLPTVPTDLTVLHTHTMRLVDANGDDVLSPLRRGQDRIENLLIEIRDLLLAANGRNR